MKKSNALYLAYGGIIAALYVVLTLISSAFGLSSGVIQIRISEALCILPAFTPAAIPGLVVGCVISNMLSGCAALDVVFGSLATLLGALGTYFLGSQARRHKTPHTTADRTSCSSINAASGQISAEGDKHSATDTCKHSAAQRDALSATDTCKHSAAEEDTLSATDTCKHSAAQRDTLSATDTCKHSAAERDTLSATDTCKHFSKSAVHHHRIDTISTMARRLLASACPILANTIIVPFILTYVYHLEQGIWLLFITVFAGELIAAGILGQFLYSAVQKYRKHIFK